MNNFFEISVYFGVFITLVTYALGLLLKKKFKIALFNPILISVALIMLFLVIFDIDYEAYYDGAKYISYLLTPATVCLAIPLYEQFQLLKKNSLAIILGILSGTLTSLAGVFIFAFFFKMDHASYVTLLPKSITTAIGMGVSEELGGYVALTVAVIIITGLIGNMFAEVFCKLCRISDPVAKGVAIGTSAHALGTAKALEIGEIEGAISSLSIVVSGLMTVVLASIFAQFI